MSETTYKLKRDDTEMIAPWHSYEMFSEAKMAAETFASGQSYNVEVVEETIHRTTVFTTS